MIIVREETNQTVDIDLNDYNVRLYDGNDELMFFENDKSYRIGDINDCTWKTLENMTK